MFFILSKTAGLILSPLALLSFLLFFYIYLSPKSYWKKTTGIGFILCFILFTNPFVGNELLRWWEVKGTAYAALDSKYDAAVVLGGITASQQPPYDRVHTHSGADRLLHTLELYRMGKIKKIILSGGSGRLAGDSVSEAKRMYKILTLAGVPKRHLLLEEGSKNTYENARNTKSILLNNELKPPYLLVTSASHMRRAEACFKANNTEVKPFSVNFIASSPPFSFDQYVVPQSGAIKAWEVLFKEWAGFVSYWLRGYL